MSSSSVSWQMAGSTDIGGGVENQDCFLMWEDTAQGVCVACVCDGHGKEVGRVASFAACDAILKLCKDNTSDLLANPVSWLVNAHNTAHFVVKEEFRKHLRSLGQIVEETVEGYLVKRKDQNANWGCVHGGTSCSIVVIIGTTLYISNVGDSSAILCAKHRIFTGAHLEHVVDAAISPSSSLQATKLQRNAPKSTVFQPDSTDNTNFLVLTAEHSPESLDEFYRFRSFRSKPSNPNEPEIGIVYDAQGVLKVKCPSVFTVDAATGTASLSNRGKYYKNVRHEWATLVHTPTTAKFQDALAFTRSLGDLHLATFGISHLPEIQKVDLAAVFANHRRASSNNSSNNNPDPAAVLSIVLCSDGVWDNWLYEDVSGFVMDQSCVSVCLNGASGCGRINKAFMQRNDVFAKQNFGSHADNATCVLLYLSEHPNFPSSANPKGRISLSSTNGRAAKTSSNERQNGNNTSSSANNNVSSQSASVSDNNSNSNNGNNNSTSTSASNKVQGAGSGKSSSSKPQQSTSSKSNSNSALPATLPVTATNSSSTPTVAAPLQPTAAVTPTSEPPSSEVASRSTSNADALDATDSIAVAIAEQLSRSSKSGSPAPSNSEPSSVVTAAVVPSLAMESGGGGGGLSTVVGNGDAANHVVSPRLSAAGALVIMSPTKPL